MARSESNRLGAVKQARCNLHTHKHTHTHTHTHHQLGDDGSKTKLTGVIVDGVVTQELRTRTCELDHLVSEGGVKGLGKARHKAKGRGKARS